MSRVVEIHLQWRQEYDIDNIPYSAPKERQYNIYAPPEYTPNLNKPIQLFEFIGWHNLLLQHVLKNTNVLG